MTKKTLSISHAAMAALGVSWLAAAPQAQAADTAMPFLSPIFGDDMVLQRDQPDRIWGWTTPGAPVTVTLNGKTASATAGSDGKWMATLPAQPAGGPYTLTVQGPQTLTLKNILMGDVWICSGQSNMELGVGASSTGPEAVASANYPNIRLFRVPHIVEIKPQATIPTKADEPYAGHWIVTSPETVGNGGWSGFSAVGYFFGRKLHTTLHVPIGLIQNPWSGMPAEAFVSTSGLKTVDNYKQVAADIENLGDPAAIDSTDAQKQEKWYADNDPGTKASPTWAAVNTDDSTWGALPTPGLWEGAHIAELSDFDGVLWYRTAFDAPTDWADQDVTLNLGTIDDDDTTFVNGTQIGTTSGYTTARHYTVPGALIHAGHNVIAVRVLDTGGGGGLYGNAADLSVALAAKPTNTIPLAGNWKYHIGQTLKKMGPPRLHIDIHSSATPSVLYDGMVAPLVPLAIKGAIWYQGESNAGRDKEYRQLMPALIQDWRKQFGSDFPFFLVQLASWNVDAPGNTSWALLREAQLYTIQHTPKTGMAVSMDIGNATDIHPKDKQDVGERLALNALAIAYGQKIEYSGPIYQSMTVTGSKVRLTFTHATGLAAKGGPLHGFTVAGADHAFVPADAVIDGNTIVVSAPSVTSPLAVRYAFVNYLADPNLTNAAGLPASPFRTDAW